MVFDASMSVAINASLSLTAGWTYRYDSDPGIGIKKGDAVYVTGIGVKWD
jgi:putative salt-induced outer membrane protein YdiY